MLLLRNYGRKNWFVGGGEKDERKKNNRSDTIKKQSRDRKIIIFR